MNSVPSKPSVHQAMLRPIMSFIYYRLCVVYLKYWNIQILSYRKNKYMSTRFSHFTFPWSSSDSSLSDSREFLSNRRSIEYKSTTMRWSEMRSPRAMRPRSSRSEVPSKRGHLFFVILWGTTSGFWRIRFRTIFSSYPKYQKTKEEIESTEGTF